MAKVKFRHRLHGLFFFFIIVFIILSLTLRAQAQEKLRVDGNLAVKSSDSGPPRYGLVLLPQASAPASPQEGQLYYNNNDNYIYYYDGNTWQICGGSAGDRYVASKIVAAYDSLDSTRDGSLPTGSNFCLGDGTTCINPQADYTCDGRDDQQEINKAINSLTATAGAGAVYLLEGAYNISATLLEGETLVGIVPHNNTAIIGTGSATVLKVFTGTNNLNVINAQNVSGILISQLTIDGNNKTGSNNRGVNFSSVTNSKIEKAWIENIQGSGIYLSDSSRNIVFNNNLQGNGGSIIASDSNNNTISTNNIQNNGGAVTLEYTSNNIVSGNNIQSNTGSGISLSGWGPELPSRNNIVSGNNIQSNTGSGINTAQGSNESVVSTNIISTNNIQDNTGRGIAIDSASNIISANLLFNNGGTGTFDGIYISENKNLIFSNRISDSVGGGYGIYTGHNCCTMGVNYYAGNFIDGAGYPIKISRSLNYGDCFMDKLDMGLEAREWVSASNNTTLPIGDYPKGLVYVYHSGSVTLNSSTAIPDGKARGDLLIIYAGAPSWADQRLTIPNNANTLLGGSRTLYGRSAVWYGMPDVLVLIWNGDDWVELSYKNN